MPFIYFGADDGDKREFITSRDNNDGWEDFHEWAKEIVLNDSKSWVAAVGTANIGPSGGQALGKSLQIFTDLQTLNLYSNGFGPAGGVAVAQALPSVTSLRVLWLSWNNIGPSGGQALGKALPSLTSLEKLHLSHNNIGPSGGEAIAKGLFSLTSLHTLELAVNEIGPSGAEALTSALLFHTALQELDLGGNHIGTTGAHALCKTLPSLTALQRLSLYSNNIKASGAEALGKALPSLTSLRRLYLSDNSIGMVGIAVLGNVIPSLFYLQTMELQDDEEAMGVYRTLNAINRRDIDVFMGAPSINSWAAYDIAFAKFKPSRQFTSAIARLLFLAQCFLFTSDAVLDVVTMVALWGEGNVGWGRLMLFLYLLPAIMVLFEEGKGKDPCDSFFLKAGWFLGTATQITPLFYMIKSFKQGKEAQEYVRSNTRQVVYESIPQAWLQFYIFLRQSQLRCDAEHTCSLNPASSTLLLLLSFVFSTLSTAWSLGSLQWAQIGSGGVENSKGNSLSKFFKGIWQQAMQVHMLHFVFEATSRMVTIGMLGLSVQGWPVLGVLAGMFVLRVLLLSTGPTSRRSTDLMRKNHRLLLTKSVQSVASAYFCDTALWINRACVGLSVAETGVALGLFGSGENGLPESVQTGTMWVAGVSGVIGSVGMLVRPFNSVRVEHQIQRNASQGEGKGRLLMDLGCV